MKKHTICVIARCIVVSYHAQSFSAGIEGGSNVIMLRGNELAESHHPKLGLSAGLTGIYSSEGLFVAETGAFVEHSTLLVNFNTVSPPPEIAGAELHYRYLTFPVLVGIQLGRDLRFTAKAGAFISTMLQAYSIITHINGNSATPDETMYFKKINIGTTLKLGVEFDLSQRVIFSLEACNQYGVSDISSMSTINERGLRTNLFSAMAGISYKFRLKGNKQKAAGSGN